MCLRCCSQPIAEAPSTAMQGLRRLTQALPASQRSASTLGRAAEAVKNQVSSAAAAVSDTAKAATKTVTVEGKHGMGYIQFLEVCCSQQPD